MQRSSCLSLFAAMFCLLLSVGTESAVSGQDAQANINHICPGLGVQNPAPGPYGPGGIILTYFDKQNIWVFNASRFTRYPLPQTSPCGTNCHLSQDSTWITYLDSGTQSINMMRLDGTQRTPIAQYATEVFWWSSDTLLIWTPAQDAYLRALGDDQVQLLDTDRVISIQPGGFWALRLEQQGDLFVRVLSNLDPTATSEDLVLGVDMPYFSAASWSPDGSWLAFTAPVTNSDTSTELYGIRPGDSAATSWTRFTQTLGPVRINGHAPGELSWSPDGTRLAFWVLPLTGSEPDEVTSEATIHVLDVTSGEINAYCDLRISEHTPNPPRLVWSPDSTHLAFGANLPEDTRGYLLLGLELESGIFSELSAGIFPAFGSANAIAWGSLPQ